jgi:L-amino acid N-acyltransferase YncA
MSPGREAATVNRERAAATIRDAEDGDAQAVSSLYGHYVRTSLATFEESSPDAHEMRMRMREIRDAGLPWHIALDEDRNLLGYAYASPYRSRSAYRYTLENSVYVRHDQARRGIGCALMRGVIECCAELGYRQMLAVIGDSANEASIRLHSRLGFTMVGTHAAVGYKLGRWVDVVHMQLTLGLGAVSPPSTHPGPGAALPPSS